MNIQLNRATICFKISMQVGSLHLKNLLAFFLSLFINRIKHFIFLFHQLGIIISGNKLDFIQLVLLCCLYAIYLSVPKLFQLPWTHFILLMNSLHLPKWILMVTWNLAFLNFTGKINSHFIPVILVFSLFFKTSWTILLYFHM